MIKKDLQKTETTKNLNILVKSSIFVLIGLFFSKVFSYVYKIIIARNFGPEAYGLFSLAFIIATLVATLASLGLSEGLMRYVSYFRGKNENKKIKTIIKKANLYSVFLSILCGIVLFFASDWIAVYIFNSGSLEVYLRIFSFAVPFMVLSSNYLAIIRGFEKIKELSFLSNILNNLLRVVLLISFILIGIGENSIGYSFTLAFVGLTFFSYGFARRLSKYLVLNKKEIENKAVFKELWAYSLPLIFISILYSIFYWTDSIMIGALLDVENVGLYNAAATLAGFLAIAPEMFMQLFIPLISKSLSQKKGILIMNLTKQITKWIYAINLPVVVCLIFFPGVFLNIFFGAEYLVAENTLRILALGALFSVFSGMFSGMLNIKMKSKRVLFVLILAGILNIILNFLLIPKYGINGAALATIVSWGLFAIILFFYIKKEYGSYPIKKDIIKISLINLIMISSLLFLERFIVPTLLNLILVGCFFILGYLVLIFLFGGFDENDLEIIKKIRKTLLRA
jgi:O-antigen/teichoic acid export membrane protein